LTQRLFGFELLMAPYTIAHLKLGLMLYPPSAPTPKPPPRLGIYLTNTLELPDEQIPMQLGPWRIISQEAADAVTVKRETPLLVIIGNPPYSANSANKIEWIEALIRKDYYPRDHIKEQNPKLLLDDYVKFIRWAQWRLERTGGGILAFVTNHGYLQNPTFRRMRRALMEAFDELYLLNLHGNAREGETAPDGSPDENVFDIQQGVALLIAVRNFPNADAIDKIGDAIDTIGTRNDRSGVPIDTIGDAIDRIGDPDDKIGDAIDKIANPDDSAVVWYCDVWGTREAKYAFLNQHTLDSTPWQALQPQPPFYLFAPQEDALRTEYERGWRLTDIFRLHSTGIKTHRDHFAIAFDQQTLLQRIGEFRDLTIPDDEIRQRYALKDTRDWKLRESRQKLAHDPNWQAHFHPCLYRPFDVRWIYYSPTVIELPRDEVMQHLIGGQNLALISVRQHTQADEWALVGVSDKLTECCAISNKTGEINYVFPLYLLTQDGREPNLHEKFLQALRAVMDREPTPEEVLAYIYAVLHAPSYRQRYAPFLRYDYPRVPLPASAEQFVRLASLGQHLIELHLLRCLSLRESPVGFPVSGSNRVERGYPRYRDGAVWINDSQRFTGVSQAVWAMRVGGLLKSQVLPTPAHAHTPSHHAPSHSAPPTADEPPHTTPPSSPSPSQATPHTPPSNAHHASLPPPTLHTTTDAHDDDPRLSALTRATDRSPDAQAPSPLTPQSSCATHNPTRAAPPTVHTPPHAQHPPPSAAAQLWAATLRRTLSTPQSLPLSPRTPPADALSCAPATPVSTDA
jgi:hypothetical protein